MRPVYKPRPVKSKQKHKIYFANITNFLYRRSKRLIRKSSRLNRRMHNLLYSRTRHRSSVLRTLQQRLKGLRLYKFKRRWFICRKKQRHSLKLKRQGLVRNRARGRSATRALFNAEIVNHKQVTGKVSNLNYTRMQLQSSTGSTKTAQISSRKSLPRSSTTTQQLTQIKALHDSRGTNFATSLQPKRSRRLTPRKNQLRDLVYTRTVTNKKQASTRSYNLNYTEGFSMYFQTTRVSQLGLSIYQILQNRSYEFIGSHLALLTTTYGCVTSLHTFNVLNLSVQNYTSYVQSQTLLNIRQDVKACTLMTTTQNLFYSNQISNLLLNNRALFTRGVPTIDEALLTNPLARQAAYINNLHKNPYIKPGARLRTGITQQWYLESDFLRRKNLTSPNAVFVLAKAPTYRMGLASNSPISTSQHYGNFFNAYSHLPDTSTSSLPLFAKSTIGSTMRLVQKPHRGGFSTHNLHSTHGSILTHVRKQQNLLYKDLLYVKPIVSLTIQPTLSMLPSPDTKHKIFNLKQITTFRRKSYRIASRSKPRPLRKQKFMSKQHTLSTKRKRALYKSLKKNLKRMLRFSRWKTKKATFYFNKFLRINKSRKHTIKALAKSNFIHSKSTKYSSFLSKTKLCGSTHQKNLTLTNYNVSALVHDYASNNNLNILTHQQTALFMLWNPILLKSFLFPKNNSTSYKSSVLSIASQYNHVSESRKDIHHSNLTPHHSFSKHFSKKVLNSFANRLFREDVIPFYQNTLIRFIEFCTGKKALFQFYPFVNQHISKDYMVRYKKWLPRMGFYERRLGHRFFLEESLHIMHISFALRDPKIIASWLRAIILRISFWKTRSIFRFLKYLFHNYFIHVFDDIRIKGLKIRLKGKISAAGNSRKRTILYRVGNTSHSEVNLRVVKDFSLINTFTGVMGFQVYLFY
jgi:hypothetical protein